MTFEQAFTKVKAKFSDADLTKLNGDFAIQVNMTDEDCGGTFYIQSQAGKLNVEPYDYRDNTANVTVKKLDLYKILDSKISVEKAVESGKVTIDGNPADLANAVACIKIPAPKKIVKKVVEASEKKASAAKKAIDKVSAAETKATPIAKKATEKKTTAAKKSADKKTTKK